MKHLVNLRHLSISYGRHVPVEVGCLTRLQTLPIFEVGTEMGRGIGELGGELVLHGLEKVRDKEEAEGARLWEKKNLRKLTYDWDLSWEGDCKYYPSWLVQEAGGASFQPMNLVELKLMRCENVKNLPPLGQYPNLKCLEIEGLKSVWCMGNEFYTNGCDENKPVIFFPALEVFTLRNLRQVKEWSEVEPTNPVFPSLKQLKIEGCNTLSSVPRISRISSLEELNIVRCSELGWMGDEPFSSSLKKLTIRDCRKLRSIPSLDGLSSLLELELEECKGLASVPSGLSTCTSLRRLLVGHCSDVESIPEDVGQLHSLEKLRIRFCGNLKRLPEESLGCLTSLKALELGPLSKELEEFPGLGSIHHLHSSQIEFLWMGQTMLFAGPTSTSHRA
ncbi:hypothetical protein V6N12_003355 [Hibiscus sabdariffa]|uniref:R13L1/DRL21-like LRR repeat region domain-containing protein n=2 Tax=Hibiscus sabdariffa TaxID=183260 RepID=A0ABR2EBL9_9ROSI